jgi:DNA transformation protein
VDPDHIQELFAGFGAVAVRRMFGGAGLYADGVMFGLVSGGEIYLKADAGTVPCFEAEGCGPFEYGTRTGSRAIASFRKLPERLYDDPDELADWARQALGAARRSGAAKRKPGRKAPVKKKAARKSKKRR